MSPIATSDGAKIYLEEHGEGDPLLLIMGLGYTHEMWHRTVPVMAEHYRTIVFDNRGVGRSDAPPGPYSIAGMAADAAAVLDAAGVSRAHVFGISMGGMIAQEFALQYPNRVAALILGCTAFGGPNAKPAAPEVLRVLMGRATMTPEEGSLAMVPYIYDASTPRERVEEDLAIRRQTYPAGYAYLAQVQAIQAWQSYDRLSQIKSPTLVIHGETDQLVPPENGKLLASRIPGTRLAMLASASHVFPTDQPEKSHELVLSFLHAQSVE